MTDAEALEEYRLALAAYQRCCRLSEWDQARSMWSRLCECLQAMSPEQQQQNERRCAAGARQDAPIL